jgi:hypothetical protein
MPKGPFDELADPSALTDADWAELNKLKTAYEKGGPKAFSKAFEQLKKDPVGCVHVLAAIFPERIREQMRDALAESGITEEDLREMLRKAESPSPVRH